MTENLSLPGFERSYMYTGEEKGGLDPEEEVDLLRRPLPLLNTYITYIPYSTQSLMNLWIYLIYLLHLL